MSATFLKKGATIRPSDGRKSLSRRGERVQIGTGEEHVQPILVFSQSEINRFSESENTFDNAERKFQLQCAEDFIRKRQL